jgi:hypothetical protein
VALLARRVSRDAVRAPRRATSPGTVVVDVEGTGDHPAPEKVAEALTDAVRLLTAAGVEVQWDEWEAVP